jgi:hypothetical protein
VNSVSPSEAASSLLAAAIVAATAAAESLGFSGCVTDLL